MMTSTLLAVVLAWWPYPAVDTCTPVRDVLGGGAKAEVAASELAGLGHVAVAAILEGLAGAPDAVAAMRLLELLASQRDARAQGAIQPYVFHPDPAVAALATRVLFLSTGARALPTFAHLLALDRSFEQTLAAIEGLREMGLPTAFAGLSAYVVVPAHDPILRGLALEAAVAANPKQARKWLRGVVLESGAPAWLATKLAAARSQVEVSGR